MLDTLRAITTPELIEVQLHPAGILPRALAWLIDMLIRTVIWFILAIALGALGGFGGGVLFICFFLLEWFYPVLFEVLGRGATPGKRALQLTVVHDNGTPVGWGASLTRNLLRTADFLPVFYVFGAASMIIHHEFRRLGDIVAGTLVVHNARNQQLAALPAALPLPSAEPLDRPTQRALVAFAERAGGLTDARQEELAALVPHLAQAADGPQGAQRLLGLANFVIGRRA